MSTSERAVTDVGIREQVLRSWRSERSLDASTLDLTVDVGGNRVVLRGDVGSATNRVTALQIAAGLVPRSFPVRNQILVRPPLCDPAGRLGPGACTSSTIGPRSLWTDEALRAEAPAPPVRSSEAP